MNSLDTKRELLTPQDCVVALVDHQPQMAFAVQSAGIADVINNVTGLAKTARLFDVPVVLTSVSAESFSGPVFEEITDVLTDVTPIDRTTMNAWEDERFRQAVSDTGRKKLVIAGLWTEVCVVFPVLQAMADGYEVFVVSDASAGTSREAHDLAMDRMVQAGAVPVTWVQFLLELQRDWARTDTARGAGDICRQHAGMYGIGIKYFGAISQHATRS